MGENILILAFVVIIIGGIGRSAVLSLPPLLSESSTR